MKTKVILFLVVLVFLLGACETPKEYPIVDREDMLPADIEKEAPETDNHPPIMHTDEFEIPVPLPYPVNTSGGEDSPFILPDGNTLYFFFTPDVRIPPNEQLTDNVTGIWVSCKHSGSWTKPKRVWLQDAGKLALDGAAFIRDDEMWFASAREGYTGLNIFTAQKSDDIWQDWAYAGDKFGDDFMMGELHIFEDELYYHSERDGGMGSLDIWMTKKTGDIWSEPLNITAVNSDQVDGFPCISPDGSEMWFTRVYLGTPAIFRSYRIDGQWQEPELIVSQFAGEPTVDAAGNLYFVHHYYEDDIMIEADIYIAYKKHD